MNLKREYLHIIVMFSLISITNTSSNNTLSNDSLPKNIGKDMVKEIEKLLFLLPENTKISFNDSLINVTLYNTSNPSFNSEKTNIDFKNCLTILQKVYDLDPFYDKTNMKTNEIIFTRYYFIIIKIAIKKKNILIENSTDINNDNNNNSFINYNNIKKFPTNHIQYIIFDGRTKKMLNASYCNDLNIKISYPIVNETGLNLSVSQKLYDDYGFDVFNPNDNLFNDFCINFTSDKKTDLSLKQKRKLYFQNVSYCDKNCTYMTVNYTTKKAICACEVKSNSMIYNEISNSLIDSYNERNESFNAEDVNAYINYKVLACYKQVFNIDRLKYNFGSYAMLSFLVLYTICVIHFYYRRKTNLMYFYQNVQNLNKAEKNVNQQKNDNIKNDGEEKNEKNCEEESKKNETEKYENIIISDISCPPNKKILKLQDETQKDEDFKYMRNRMDTDIALMENDNNITNTNNDINNESRIKKIRIMSLISTTSSPFTEGRELNTTKSNSKKIKITNSSFHLNNYSEYIISNINKKSTIFFNLNNSMELPSPNYGLSNLNNSFKTRHKKISSIAKKKKRKNIRIHNNFLNKYDINNDNQEDRDIYIERSEKNYNKNNNSYNNSVVNKKETSIIRKPSDASKKRQKSYKNLNFIKNIKNMKNINNKDNKNLFIDFNEMKFEIAILIDNRNFCKKYLDELREKYIIIVSLFKNEIMFKQLIFSSYILNISTDFFFNALFNSDDYIEKKYDLSPLDDILLNYPKQILSSFCTQFIVKIFEIIIDYKALELFITRTSIHNKKYFKSINYLMKKFEKRTLIYVCISYVFYIFMWYYCSAFCTTYQNTQKSLAFDSLNSFGINLLLPVPLSFLSVSLRHLAIKKLSKILFLFSNLVKVLS